jgi:site-specific DNA-methyltransferase (adenine-specific)
MNIAHNMDCMEAMRCMPDKAFDLAIVDPPYGLERMKHGAAKNNRTGFATGDWNNRKPTQEYFSELFRVSSKSIIWGANNFTLPESEYFIIWDKQQPINSYADAEYAWTNCKMPAKVFRFSVFQLMADRKDDLKIHPTQKPVKLYEWLLTNYAKPGNRILDTHLGSGSSRIAAYNLGFDFIGYEIDKDYFDAQEERFKAHTSQISLFAEVANAD